LTDRAKFYLELGLKITKIH